jgi:hypothetical protein
MATSPLHNTLEKPGLDAAPAITPGRLRGSIKKAVDRALTFLRDIYEGVAWGKHMGREAKLRWPHIFIEDEPPRLIPAATWP